MRSLLGLIILVFLLGQSFDSFGQKKKKKKFNNSFYDENAKPPNGFLVDFSYGVHMPFADMAENYIYNFSLGGKIQYILSNNLAFGLVGDFQFVDGDVRTDVLSSLREPEGFIIDRFGQLTDAQLGQRGFFLGASVSYLIPVFKKYKRSGIEVRFEGGYQQHWMRIEILGGEVFGLTGDYKNGYDRMTTGFAMRQYIGYRHLDKNRLLNFFGGFDIMEAFTKNRRGYNFDTMQADTKDRIDILLGFRIGITLPIYIYTPETQEDVRFY